MWPSWGRAGGSTACLWGFKGCPTGLCSKASKSRAGRWHRCCLFVSCEPHAYQTEGFVGLMGWGYVVYLRQVGLGRGESVLRSAAFASPSPPPNHFVTSTTRRTLRRSVPMHTSHKSRNWTRPLLALAHLFRRRSCKSCCCTPTWPSAGSPSSSTRTRCSSECTCVQ